MEFTLARLDTGFEFGIEPFDALVLLQVAQAGLQGIGIQGRLQVQGETSAQIGIPEAAFALNRKETQKIIVPGTGRYRRVN